jgi:hypothetical protein
VLAEPCWALPLSSCHSFSLCLQPIGRCSDGLTCHCAVKTNRLVEVSATSVEFSPITWADYHRFVIFLMVSVLAIFGCSLYGEALAILRK